MQAVKLEAMYLAHFEQGMHWLIENTGNSKFFYCKPNY